MHEEGSSHGDTRIMRLTPGEGEVYVALARRAGTAWRTWEGLAGQPLIEWTGGLMAGPRGSPFVAACQRLSRKPAALLRGDAIHPLTRGYIAMPYEWDVFRQEDAGVIAADATRAFLLKQAVRWGAKLFHRTKIDAPVEGLSFTVNGEKREFDSVIVAAGGWGAKLLPEFDNDVGVYGMPAPRGLYKFGLHAIGGATDPDEVREPDDADAALLSEHAAPLLPKHNPKPVRMKRCLYTVTPDENFVIKASAANNRVLMFSACSGHGFKYAPVFGELAQEWLMGVPSQELEALMNPNANVNRLGAPKL
jgi:sarcosine oxidase